MLFIGGIVVGDGINVVLLLVVSYSNHYSLLWRFFFCNWAVPVLFTCRKV